MLKSISWEKTPEQEVVGLGRRQILGECMCGDRNRGIAAPAFICSGQTVLLDIWEKGSKADVLSVTATVQAAAALLPSVRCAMAPQAPATSTRKGIEHPCQGIEDWGCPCNSGESQSQELGSRGKEGRTDFLLRIEGLAGI